MSPASLEHLCEEIGKVRGVAGGEDRYRQLLAEVEEYFWRECEAAAVEALPAFGDELEFGPAEKLLIDAGLVEVTLVQRAGRDFLERLTAELNQVGSEGVVYLTEWLSKRYSSFLATRQIPGEGAAESPLLQSVDRDDSEMSTARSQRNQLYARLAGIFRRVPGVSVELAGAIAGGAVDDRIEELLLAQAARDRAVEGGGRGADQEAGTQARRYDRVVQGLLRGSRELTDDEEPMRYLEAVGKLRMAIFRRSLALAKENRSAGTPAAGTPAESRTDPEVTRAESEAFIRQELHVLRSVLRIGSRDAQGESACSVLLSDVPRSTKRAVHEVMSLVSEVDPGLSVEHDLLIAPFTGSGFFEWDRNTLVVALNPASSAELAVVNAVASFRLLSDSRDERSPISTAYRSMYGPEFRGQFLKDYRNWVLRVGRGKREALPDRSYRFFLEHIAPPPSGPIVPRELIHLTVGERRQEAKRLGRLVRTGSFTADEAFRLASLLWQQEKVEEAVRCVEKVLEMDAGDGRALYSLGVLCRKKRLASSARKAFREVVRRASDSLWNIYAQDALRRMV